jgi:hypothetical protein
MRRRVAALTMAVIVIALGCIDETDAERAAAGGDSTAATPPNRGEGAAQAVTAPTALPVGFALTDTATYLDETSEGELALLRRDGAVVDSIDLGFGVHAVGTDSVLYVPVSRRPGPEDDVRAGPDGPVLWARGARRSIESLGIPYFDPSFSAPAVHDSVLYYWGWSDRGTGTSRLYGARYDFASRAVDTVFVAVANVATDDPGYLPRPARQGEAIVFVYDSVRRTLPLAPRRQTR